MSRQLRKRRYLFQEDLEMQNKDISEKMDHTPIKRQRLTENNTPTSSFETFKLDAFIYNGKQITSKTAVELGDEDAEDIWTTVLRRDWADIQGFIIRKRGDTIRLTYHLEAETSVRDLVNDSEVTYERKSLAGPEIFKLRVAGLQNVREAKIGEIVVVNARGTGFEVKPVQVLEWMEKFGAVVGDFR